MNCNTGPQNVESIENLEKRIQYIAEAAVQLASTIPSVSHALMRQALCHLKDINGSLPENQGLYLCFNCGVVRTHGVNTTVRCQRTNARQRKKCRKKFERQKMKNKGLLTKDAPIVSHKTVVTYHCNSCNAKLMLPGAPRTVPATKKMAKHNPRL